MSKMKMMEILDKLAALEVAAADAGLDHELWMLRAKLQKLEEVQ